MSILVATGFVRIESDTAPAQKAFKALGATASSALSTGILPAAAAAVGAIGAITAAAATAAGGLAAYKVAVTQQFDQIKEASEKQTSAEDAKAKATANAALAQKLAKDAGFAYGKSVEITEGMTDSARQAAEEYNAALSASKSASRTAEQAQQAYKAKLAELPPATRQTAEAMQNLKDSTTSWSDSLSSSTMPVFTRGIRFLESLLPKLTPIVKDVAREVDLFVNSLGKGQAGTVFRTFGKNVQQNAGGAVRGFLKILRNVAVGFVGVLNAFAPFQGKLGGGLTTLTGKFANFGATLSSNKGFQSFMETAQEAAPRVAEALSALARAFGEIVTAAGPLAGIGLTMITIFADLVASIPTPALELLVPAIIAVNLAMKAYAVYQAAAAAVNWLFFESVVASNGAIATSRYALLLFKIQALASAVATGVMTAATWALSAAMTVLTSPIGIVVLAIAALVAAFIIAWKKSETFRNIVRGAMKGVVDAGKAIGEWFSGPFVRFFTETIPSNFRAFIDWIKGVWDGITEGAAAMYRGVVDFFTRLPADVLDRVTSLPTLLYDSGLALIRGLLNGAVAITRTLGQWMRSHIFEPTVNFFNQAGRWLYNKGRDILMGMLSGWLSITRTINQWLFSHVFRPTINFFSRAGSWLWNKGRDIISGLFSGLLRRWSDVTAWLQERPRAFRDRIGDLSSTLFNRGKDLISGLWNGLKDKWRDAIGWVRGLKDRVVSAIKAAFGINSPARAMIPLGVHIMGGLMKGILSSQSVLKSAVKGIFSSVTDVFKNGGQLVTDLFGSVGGSIGLGDSSVTGGAQQYAQMMLKAMGWGPSQWPALKALWQAESGWNPLAHNPSSGAHGIPQSLPANKMASEGSDYWTNPATQIRWGLKYIKGRYGSPAAAWSFWQRQSPHWYDSGGLARGIGFLTKMTNKPERVLSPRQTAAFEKLVPHLAAAASGAGTGGTTIIIEKLVLENQSVIGSKRELENWLVSTFDHLRRQGRIRTGS